MKDGKVIKLQDKADKLVLEMFKEKVQGTKLSNHTIKWRTAGGNERYNPTANRLMREARTSLEYINDIRPSTVDDPFYKEQWEVLIDCEQSYAMWVKKAYYQILKEID